MMDSSVEIINMEEEDEGEYEWVIDPEEGIPKRRKVEESDVSFSKDNSVAKDKVEVSNDTLVTPGQRLSIANEYIEAGEGAYEYANAIYASIAGWVLIEKFAEQELTLVSVRRKDHKPPFTSPNIGSIVTCTVISRTYNLARCLITHVGDIELDEAMRGIIRREYIVEKQRDTAEIQSSFGVGDIVLARVVGIGDGDFIMSTSEDSLGVASATSDAGYQMIPINWTTMECPVTKQRFSRKVAKIIPATTPVKEEKA